MVVSCEDVDEDEDEDEESCGFNDARKRCGRNEFGFGKYSAVRCR